MVLNPKDGFCIQADRNAGCIQSAQALAAKRKDPEDISSNKNEKI